MFPELWRLSGRPGFCPLEPFHSAYAVHRGDACQQRSDCGIPILRLSRGRFGGRFGERFGGHFVARGEPEESLEAAVAEWGAPCRMPGPPGGKPLPANRI